MPDYQPVFRAVYVERHSRLTTFFRSLLALPHWVLLTLWGIAAYVAVVIAWFALIITGRYPDGLYGFVGGFVRYNTFVSGYLALLTDEYPPFGDADQYPVALLLPPPRPAYSRLKALFRIILAIPPYIVSVAMSLVWSIGSFLAWFVIVITGRLPKGLHDMIVLGLSYQQRAFAYMMLLTEDWPPFTDDRTALQAPASGGDLTSSSTASAPTAPERPTGQSSVSSGDPLDG